MQWVTRPLVPKRRLTACPKEWPVSQLCVTAWM